MDHTRHPTSRPDVPAVQLDRRNFMKLCGVGTVGLGLGVAVFTRGYAFASETTKTEVHRILMRGTKDFRGFKVNEITPNDMFYLTTYDGVPNIDVTSWSLRIEGLVEKPQHLTMAHLEAMQNKTEAVTLECIGNPVGGSAIGNAVWEGVTLQRILEEVRPKHGIQKVVFYAAEGYTDSIPFAMATAGQVFLAFKMNGVPLPKQHGFPLRAVVPGIYGMKNVKWLQKIALVDYDFKGYWERRGWSDVAVIQTLSQILMPMQGKTIAAGTYVLGGIAYAGGRGIRQVEVSTDGGSTWHAAELRPPLSRFAWTLWRYQWTGIQPGGYRLKVRATDGTGKLQAAGGFFSSSYPNGATGIQEISIRAE